MSESFIFQFLIGALGGMVGEAIVFLSDKRRKQGHFKPGIAFLIILGAGLLTVLNLAFLEELPFDNGVFFHYGLFIALLAEHINQSVREAAMRQAEIPVRVRAAPSFILAATPLVLNGFWPVYSVGAFGALLMEIRILYRDRKKK